MEKGINTVIDLEWDVVETSKWPQPCPGHPAPPNIPSCTSTSACTVATIGGSGGGACCTDPINPIDFFDSPVRSN